MLTIDDANSIIKKYGNSGFWYKLETSKIDISDLPSTIVPMDYYSGGFKVRFISDNVTTFQIQIVPVPHFATMIPYIKYTDGTIGSLDFKVFGTNMRIETISRAEFMENPFDIYIYITDNSPVVYYSDFTRWGDYIFIPQNETVISINNGEYNDKFYIIPLGSNIEYRIDNTVVELEEDENGKFLRLPPHDCTLGVTITYGRTLPLYNITFREFKTLPIPYVPTLYKGTPQNIQVLNSEDDDPISDYQTYYQGRQLKDNTIRLPYDADDYINIIVDLKDYRYPFCTVKLKAPTTIYQADSQSDVESAIENGIQTLQVGDNETEVTLNSIELSNVTLINSNIQVSESILTDCQIIDTTYTDNGGNNITSTIFKDTDYTTAGQSNYNEVTFNECDIYDSEINLTGTITDSTITDTLIISDGTINIRDNTFTGVGAKEYFPSHLYLTGVYNVTGNTFNLTGEWTELEYNMCLIKATNNFNPSNFIKQNNLQLNITYDDEPTNTFYYNIVDDDKIRAVRL